jgi:hypothetical protein
MYFCVFELLLQHSGTTPIKVLASQGKSINLYKNLRTKVMKCCANVYLNLLCLIKKVTPKYANINIPYSLLPQTSPKRKYR